MLLYPAIDLMDGQAVRLRQGRAGDKTVYSDDPTVLGAARTFSRGIVTTAKGGAGAA